MKIDLQSVADKTPNNILSMKNSLLEKSQDLKSNS